jgi:hypothetical protein
VGLPAGELGKVDEIEGTGDDREASPLAASFLIVTFGGSGIITVSRNSSEPQVVQVSLDSTSNCFSETTTNSLTSIHFSH